MHTREEVKYSHRWNGSWSQESLVGYKGRVKYPRHFWNVIVFESLDSEKTKKKMSVSFPYQKGIGTGEGLKTKDRWGRENQKMLCALDKNTDPLPSEMDLRQDRRAIL